MHLELDTHSEDETRAAAARVVRMIAPGAIIALTGPLGSGKTCFARGFIEAFHGAASPFLGSPTFTLVHEYPGVPCPVYHFDFYRLARPRDVFDIGWLDYRSRGHVCIVEWADRVPEAMPQSTLWMQLTTPAEGVRRIAVISPPQVAQQ